MTNTDKQQLADWLIQLERMTAATYGALDAPAELIREQNLERIRLAVEANLVRLDTLLHMRSNAIRQSLINEEVATLRAIKLLRDDLMLVELELLRTQRLPPADADKRLAEINKDYDLFLKNWVTASPLIHPETIKWFWPDINNAKRLPLLRGMPVETRVKPDDLVSPIELARAAIKQETKPLLTDPNAIGFGRSTVHLVGIAYILAQVELAMRFAKDQSRQADVASWYSFAAIPGDIIRELLGVLDVPIRKAIRDADPQLREKLERARREMLETLALYYSVPTLECATLAGFTKGLNAPSEIVGVNAVTEKVTVRAGLVRGDRPQDRDTMLGFMANTGFPLVYPLREVEVPPGHPILRWGRIARMVQIRSYRESLEHWHQIFFSFSETVTEQHELIADFMLFDQVRKAFAATLKRQPALNLTDRTTRGLVLASAMKSLGVQLSPDRALIAIIPRIQRYLSYFTRHTGDNVRDFGTPYLSSKWPTDLNGRQFFDCGVYAVETAFDLMRAVKSINGLTLEFRFLVFPEHVALVVYQDQTSFAVNNARIFLPRPFPASATAGQAKIDAGFSWATVAMQDAFSARFAIVPVMLQAKTLSSKQSESAFKKAIWVMYQSITGFNIVKNVGKAYFDSSKAFDAGSTLLTIYLLDLSSGKLSRKDMTEVMDRATELTEKLYLLAEILAHACNFVDTNNAGFLATIGAHVKAEDALVQAARLQGQLPMYLFVRLLQQPKQKLNAAQQQLAKLPTDVLHVNALSAAMGKANCTPKSLQSLAAAHGALQAEIDRLIKKAPDRILDKIKAASAPLSDRSSLRE
jgi:hypothetical protein